MMLPISCSICKRFLSHHTKFGESFKFNRLFLVNVSTLLPANLRISHIFVVIFETIRYNIINDHPVSAQAGAGAGESH